MPKLTHPTAGAADFPEKVVPYWERLGWEREPGDQPPAPKKLLVLARTKADATAYAREAGRGEGEWLYPADAAELGDTTPDSFDVAFLDSFTEHRHHAEIAEALAAKGFTL